MQTKLQHQSSHSERMMWNETYHARTIIQFSPMCMLGKTLFVRLPSPCSSEQRSESFFTFSLHTTEKNTEKFLPIPAYAPSVLKSHNSYSESIHHLSNYVPNNPILYLTFGRPSPFCSFRLQLRRLRATRNVDVHFNAPALKLRSRITNGFTHRWPLNFNKA